MSSGPFFMPPGVLGQVPPRVLPGRAQRVRRELAQITNTSGHTAVTATSFTDVDGLSVVLETTGRPVLVGWHMMVNRNTAGTLEVIIAVDGDRITTVGYEYSGVWQLTSGQFPVGAGLYPYYDLPAGTHTFSVQAKVDAGTGNIATDGDYWRALVWAEERW